MKSCLNILSSFTYCQAHGYCLVLMSQLTSEVFVECTDQLYMLSGSWLLSCIDESVDE